MGPGRLGAPQVVEVESNSMQLLAGVGKGLQEHRTGELTLCLSVLVNGTGSERKDWAEYAPC